MKIIKSFNILNKEINFIKNIGFVPTMGSLHKGHLSFIKNSKKKIKKVLVSILLILHNLMKKRLQQCIRRDLKNDILKLKKIKSVIIYFYLLKMKFIKKGINKKINISKNG